jgi:DNA-binding NarL/FixJ family response regulator
MIRVLLADDHPLIRAGLKAILQTVGGIEVTGEAHDSESALASVVRPGFDVLVLDLSMPGLSGLELLRAVRNAAPRLPVLILSSQEESEYGVRAIRIGAAGYINKARIADDIIVAVRTVARGGRFISAALAEALANEDGAHGHAALTNRELEILRLLVSGASVTGIAGRLALSVKTVSTHKSNLQAKLNVDSVAGLVRHAMQNGLFSDDLRA